MSEQAFTIRHDRRHPRRVGRTWASSSHLTASPNLWAELASLRGERGARPPGPWLEQSLRRHRTALETELARRLRAMERALG
jgi:hypothetical protein